MNTNINLLQSSDSYKTMTTFTINKTNKMNVFNAEILKRYLLPEKVSVLSVPEIFHQKPFRSNLQVWDIPLFAPF